MNDTTPPGNHGDLWHGIGNCGYCDARRSRAADAYFDKHPDQFPELIVSDRPEPTIEDFCPTAPPDQPTSDSLRELYAAAIRPSMLMGLQDAELDGPGGTQRIDEWVDWIAKELAEVRDREMERLKLLVAASGEPGQAVRMAAQYADRAIENGKRAEQAEARVAELEAENARLRTAWTSARARVKRAKRNRDGELRWANNMWSDALRDLHRYRQAWKSARHRAAMYLQSNENFSASLHSNNAAYLQLAARLAEYTDKAIADGKQG